MPPWWWWVLVVAASPPLAALQHIAMTYFAVVLMGRRIGTPEDQS